jgi:hypothetical protein
MAKAASMPSAFTTERKLLMTSGRRFSGKFIRGPSKQGAKAATFSFPGAKSWFGVTSHLTATA